MKTRLIYRTLSIAVLIVLVGMPATFHPAPATAFAPTPEPNIDINWVGRDKWESFDPHWDEQTVGVCYVHREDPGNKDAITKVEWILNEAFGSYEKVVTEKKLGEVALKTFKENYEYPVAFALFKQRLAEEAKEKEADEARPAVVGESAAAVGTPPGPTGRTKQGL